MASYNGRDNIVLAICYDFDKTLTPTDMQAQGYIQSVGYDVGEFWDKTNILAEKNEMDSNLAYMYVMMDEARERLIFNREKLQEYGKNVQLFQGVEDWFDRLNEYGCQRGITVEHYIISSGLKEMIDYITKKGPKKFRYHLDLEIVNDKTPVTWKEKMF